MPDNSRVFPSFRVACQCGRCHELPSVHLATGRDQTVRVYADQVVALPLSQYLRLQQAEARDMHRQAVDRSAPPTRPDPGPK